MKKIRVHGLMMDNAGNPHEAGAELVVDDNGAEGCVTAERAAQLVKINSATPLDGKADKKASAKVGD